MVEHNLYNCLKKKEKRFINGKLVLDVQLCFISIEYVVFFPMVEYFNMVSENSGNKKGIVVEYRQYSDHTIPYLHLYLLKQL